MLSHLVLRMAGFVREPPPKKDVDTRDGSPPRTAAFHFALNPRQPSVRLSRGVLIFTNGSPIAAGDRRNTYLHTSLQKFERRSRMYRVGPNEAPQDVAQRACGFTAFRSGL
jgi:hypothetical protein